MSDCEDSSQIGEVQQFELKCEDLTFVQEFLKQSETLRDFLTEEDVDLSKKNVKKQKFSEKEEQFIQMWIKQPVELQVYAEQMQYVKAAPELKFFNEKQTKLIEQWNSGEISQAVKDILSQKQQEDDKKIEQELTEQEKQMMEVLLQQEQSFLQFLMQEIEDDDEDEDNEDGWESEDAFEEDNGLKDLSKKDLEFFELWRLQSDKLQNFIIERKKNPEKCNFSNQELQFIELFKKQSREFKHLVGYEFIEY